ncbi:MAG: glutathione peroxidase [Pirellulales bacterium]
MSRLTPLLAVTLLLFGVSAAIAKDKATTKQEKKVAAALKFKMKSLAGKPIDLAKYQGKVVLFVNVASECGLTPQYRSLQALHESLGPKGLVVIGVPCNQFGGQEPGTASEIQTFCQKNYGVTFPLLEKVDVNGDKACALYKHLTSLETKPKGAGKVGWNFEKFLVGRDGEVAARFNPHTEPDSKELLKAVKAELAKN